ncbi:MAG: ribonuclease H family protein, partial [Lachnospiraceae bacterium]|nr:ribonuclease H family protein [Lachnospiraceae bacterium]
KAQVHGFAGAEYKSFKTMEEARNYIQNGTQTNLKNKKPAAINQQSIEEDTIIAYVDGSYNGSETDFSYGMVILDGKQELKFSKKISNQQLASMNNVAGEIAGAMAAMDYAVSHNKKKVMIYHDYEGIAKWCLGEWKTNREGTKAYKQYYNEMVKKVEIEFVKVKGHSNDKYNDLADELAKDALTQTE